MNTLAGYKRLPWTIPSEILHQWKCYLLHLLGWLFGIMHACKLLKKVRVNINPKFGKHVPILLPIKKNSDGRTGNLDVQRQNNNYLFRDKMKIIANTNNMWSWKRNSGHSRSWPLLIIILEKEWIGRYPGQIWKMSGLLSSTSRRELQLDADTFS